MQLSKTFPFIMLVALYLLLTSFAISPQCPVYLEANNDGPHTISILLSESEVMERGGNWNNLYYGAQNSRNCAIKALKLAPKATIAKALCNLPRTCELPRRFRFKLKVESDGQARYFTMYFPSSSGFTEAGLKSINLGDLSSFSR
ncbi:MAG: hypothetical protein AAFV07_21245 [Bacteroidota bacterium]